MKTASRVPVRCNVLSSGSRRSAWPRRVIPPTVFGLVALAIVPTASASPGTPRTRLVSLSSDGRQGNHDSGRTFVAVSADGRFVAFDSKASNLVAGDTNSVSDVFVRDRATGKTTRVSVSSSGAQANGGSFYPALSGDGRFVAFISRASNLVNGDTNGSSDVFVRDRATGKTTRVSVPSSGAQANGGSALPPAISADGRFVAFGSKASNLVGGDTNGKADVFVRDLSKQRTVRVSVSSLGNQANGPSWITHPASISADGGFVVFTSRASNLVAGDTNGKMDVFVRDAFRERTSRVSVSSAGAQGNHASSAGAISASGRFVVFSSYASNLVPGDTNMTADVFLHDRSNSKTERVSLSSSGKQGDFISCCTKGVSDDGRFVAFSSLASSLVPHDRNGSLDVFLRDRQAGTTTAISVSLSGATGNGNSGNMSISVDGRFVVFSSSASDLVPNDRNWFSDVFVRGPLR